MTTIGCDKRCVRPENRVNKACGPPVELPIANSNGDRRAPARSVGTDGAAWARLAVSAHGEARRPRPRILVRMSCAKLWRVSALGLCMQSAAPAWMARIAMAAPAVVRADATMIRTRGSTLSSSGKAVSPSITGISTSSSTMSAGVRLRVSTAMAPLATLATTSMSGSASKVREIRERMTAESSQIMTRTGGMVMVADAASRERIKCALPSVWRLAACRSGCRHRTAS